MRLVFAGTPAVAVPSLNALIASRHEVVAVLTRPDAPVGRGRRVSRSPVAVAADEAGIPVLQPATLRDEAVIAQLRALAPDLCPVVAYGALIREPALSLPTHGWVNLHFSLLPAWRGAAPVQHAIWNGDDLTGATTFRIDEGMDTGPVYGTMTEAIAPEDTSGVLLERLATSGAGLLAATVDGIDSGDLVAVPQSGEGVSSAPKISVDDARSHMGPTSSGDRSADPCLHARPGRLDDVSRRPSQDRSGDTNDRVRAGGGYCGGRSQPVDRGNGHGRGRARRGATGGQASHAGR